MTKLVNLIYGDIAHSEHMIDRYEGILLEPGRYVLNRCPWVIERVGYDEITTSNQQIIEIVRRFRRVS